MAKINLDHLLPGLLKAGEIDGVIKVLREGRATVELQVAIADMLESKVTPRLDVVQRRGGYQNHSGESRANRIAEFRDRLVLQKDMPAGKAADLTADEFGISLETVKKHVKNLSIAKRTPRTK